MERRYTLAEIDAMREAVRRRRPPPSPTWSVPAGGGFAEETAASIAAAYEWRQLCESELQTYVIAGLGPEDFPADEPKTG